MAPSSLLALPREIISQIMAHLDKADIVQANRTCEALNILCERQLYRIVSVIKYVNYHGRETGYDAIRGFFDAIKKRPERLSHIRQVDARLELRNDYGLYQACRLFEALPKMSQLISLEITIIGGVRPGRGSRALEQSLIWGCTFERGRMAIYKFFRMGDATGKDGQQRGLHALRSLRTLKILLPESMGLPTELIAYSALQHQTVKVLVLKHIANASLAPPKLPKGAGAIRDLALIGCRLPQSAYQSVFESISTLQHLDFRPLKPTGSLLNVLGRHSMTLQSLSIKMGADGMKDQDLTALGSLTHLTVYNPDWDEMLLRSRVYASDEIPQDFCLAGPLPPSLKTLTLKHFHTLASYSKLLEFLQSDFGQLKLRNLPNLTDLRLESDYVSDEHTAITLDPMYVMTVAGFHINNRMLDLAVKHFDEHKVRLSIHDKIFLQHEGLDSPKSHDASARALVMELRWVCQPERWGNSLTAALGVHCDMLPSGATERFLGLGENM